MNRSTIVPLLLAGACALPVVTLDVAPSRATVLTGACAPNATIYKGSQSYAQTSSMSYVLVPGMKTTFVQGGKTASCVIVTFSAQAYTSGGEYLRVEAVLDGTACTPANSIFVFDRPSVAADTMTYVCSGVAPGAHSLAMQYSSDAGTAVNLGDRTMIVQHVK